MPYLYHVNSKMTHPAAAWHCYVLAGQLR